MWLSGGLETVCARFGDKLVKGVGAAAVTRSPGDIKRMKSNFSMMVLYL